MIISVCQVAISLVPFQNENHETNVTNRKYVMTSNNEGGGGVEIEMYSFVHLISAEILCTNPSQYMALTVNILQLLNLTPGVRFMYKSMLQRLQTQAAPPISGTGPRNSRNPVFKELGWLSLENRRCMHKCTMFLNVEMA